MNDSPKSLEAKLPGKIVAAIRQRKDDLGFTSEIQIIFTDGESVQFRLECNGLDDAFIDWNFYTPVRT